MAPRIPGLARLRCPGRSNSGCSSTSIATSPGSGWPTCRNRLLRRPRSHRYSTCLSSHPLRPSAKRSDRLGPLRILRACRRNRRARSLCTQLHQLTPTPRRAYPGTSGGVAGAPEHRISGTHRPSVYPWAPSTYVWSGHQRASVTGSHRLRAPCRSELRPFAFLVRSSKPSNHPRRGLGRMPQSGGHRPSCKPPAESLHAPQPLPVRSGSHSRSYSPGRPCPRSPAVGATLPALPE